jgi:hypothetical protein
MSRALEDALNASTPDSATIANIERAWAAWELGGTSGTVVRRVAHLIDRAYVAMHESSGKQPEEALQGAARILYNGLPRAVRDQTDFAKIVGLVKRLENEPELWPAVVKATAEILGWNRDALNFAGHAIRVALASESEPLA